MYRKTEVEPAKSNKSSCKKCKKTIEKGQLRAKMVDDRQFRAYLKRHPDARGCEGYSRGYFEDGSKVISIQKYFVHLDCYKPIYPHPKSAEYFKLISAKADDKKTFNEWLQDKQQQNAEVSSAREKVEEKDKRQQPKARKTQKSKSKPKSKSKSKKA